MVFSSDTLSILLIVIVTVFSIILIGGLLISYIYKRIHNIPTGECAYCHVNKNKILKEYHKKYGSKHLISKSK